MSRELELQSAFNGLIKAANRGTIVFDGVILSVDEEKYTCDVQARNAKFYNVPLKVLIGSQSSICEIPEIGSNCLMSFRDGNIQRPQIFFIDKVVKIFVNCDDFNIKSKTLKVNGLNVSNMLKVIDGQPINEPGNGSPSAFQQALKTALHG